MRTADDKFVSVARLRRLWQAAVLIAAASFVVALLWITSSDGPGFDWIWGIAAFGAAAIVFQLAFFCLCSIFAPGLAALVTDDTEVHGDNVVHVVRHEEVGDEAVDQYIRTYATARASSAVAIVSGIMIVVALAFF